MFCAPSHAEDTRALYTSQLQQDGEAEAQTGRKIK